MKFLHFITILHILHPVKSKLLALYRFEEAADTSDFYTVVDSTLNSDGYLYGGKDDKLLPESIDGAWPGSKSWSFDNSPKGINILPTEVTAKFGANEDGGEYASGGATIAFAMKKENSSSFQRVITGPGVDIYELKNYISITIGGVRVAVGNDKIFSGHFRKHVITIQWGENGSISHWLDGELLATKAGTIQIRAVTSLQTSWRLARRNKNTNGDGFNGALDDFCIFNHAFNDEEVQSYVTNSGTFFLG